MANGKILEGTVSGYSVMLFSNIVSFSNGAATINHNLGTLDYIPVPIPTGNLIVTEFASNGFYENSCAIRVAFIRTANVDDSPVKTNYTGNFPCKILFFYRKPWSLRTAESGMAIGTLQKNMVLLWTNPDISVDFAGQKVSIDLSRYSHILAEYATAKTTSYGRIVTFIHRLGGEGEAFGIYGNKIVYRMISGSDSTGITYSVGTEVGTYGSGTTQNMYMIPVRIYGIKA